ncbi:MAG: TetR/AcrR family transcriptional regulator [Clostridia bacterium]|nr:TetR/AcrR family transcriptional regulator [Clostridia bacterium]
MKSNNGNLRDTILACAKKMFHNLGYEETTFQKIADEVGITKGAITYHFKNKHFIMIEIFDECFAQIREYIDRFPNEYRNQYWYAITTYQIMYRILLNNPRSMKLFYARGNQNLWEISKIDTISDIYRKITLDYHKQLSDEEIRVSANIDLGARRRLYHWLKEGNPLVSDPDHFCYYHMQLIGELCHLSQEDIQQNIRASFEFVKQHGIPDVPFLMDDYEYDE